MSWKTILSDKAKFADDRTVEIDGVKVTIGDLRTMNAATEGELAKQMDGVNQTKASLAKQQQEVADFYQRLLGEQDALTKAQAIAKPTAGFDPLTDPAFSALLKPVLDRIDATNKRNDALEGQVKQLGQAAAAAITGFIKSEYKRSYGSLSDNLDAATKQPRYKMEDLIKVATEKKLVDPDTGVFDLSQAYNALEEPRKLEAIRAKALEEGIQKGREEALLGAIPRPGAQGFVINQPTNGKTSYTFDEAVSAAMKDPDIVGSLIGSNTNGF